MTINENIIITQLHILILKKTSCFRTKITDFIFKDARVVPILQVLHPGIIIAIYILSRILF